MIALIVAWETPSTAQSVGNASDLSLDVSLMGEHLDFG